MYKKIAMAIWLLVCGIFILIMYANHRILQSSGEFFTTSTVPTSSLALIFGGGMKNKIEMSDMQWDRVAVGAQLFQLGKAQKIMITGDDGAVRDNEISAMKNRLLYLGVPISAIAIDPHGYRTYESCWREAQVYGITSTIAISQSFHLPRILYLCENFGIKTIGVTADLRQYDSWWVQNAREWLARLKAWWQIVITKPIPRVV